MRTQVTFDCADPHAQASFWAQVLGVEVEDHSDFVDELVSVGRMPADGRIVISGRSAFRDVAACRDLAGLEPRLFFQRVPESKAAKNRVHLDIHVEPDRKLAEVERLEKLGAHACSAGGGIRIPRFPALTLVDDSKRPAALGVANSLSRWIMPGKQKPASIRPIKSSFPA